MYSFLLGSVLITGVAGRGIFLDTDGQTEGQTSTSFPAWRWLLSAAHLGGGGAGTQLLGLTR